MRFLALIGACVVLLSAKGSPGVNDALILSESLPQKLSEFRLLNGPQGRVPNAGVVPYTLHTPLFSDYAEKWRYLYLPRGKSIRWSGDGVPDFPVGSVLVKSFGYPADMRRPDEAIRILETRLLIRRANGWLALPYVWNADGKDATLKRAGTRIDVRWVHTDGSRRAISYSVPNVNQCKECHKSNGEMVPIGPKARNIASGIAHPQMLQPLPRWDDVTVPVAARARAYLDVNCGHCHSPKGHASNSGLYLHWDAAQDVNFGIGKRPVAAGRGSGDFAFDIAPGSPESSIMLHRMKSLEPGIAMPELGRATAHEEGLALVSQWIAGMPKK